MARTLMTSDRHLAIEIERGPKWSKLIRFGRGVVGIKKIATAKVDKEYRDVTVTVEHLANMFLESFFKVTPTAGDALRNLLNGNTTKEEEIMAKDTGKKIAEATKRSWANKTVAKARSVKHRVKVGGVEYKSTRAAFEALKLDLNRHSAFRVELKAAGRKKFGEHTFTLVENK